MPVLQRYFWVDVLNLDLFPGTIISINKHKQGKDGTRVLKTSPQKILMQLRLYGQNFKRTTMPSRITGTLHKNDCIYLTLKSITVFNNKWLHLTIKTLLQIVCQKFYYFYIFFHISSWKVLPLTSEILSCFPGV